MFGLRPLAAAHGRPIDYGASIKAYACLSINLGGLSVAHDGPPDQRFFAETGGAGPLELLLAETSTSMLHSLIVATLLRLYGSHTSNSGLSGATGGQQGAETEPGWLGVSDITRPRAPRPSRDLASLCA